VKHPSGFILQDIIYAFSFTTHAIAHTVGYHFLAMCCILHVWQRKWYWGRHFFLYCGLSPHLWGGASHFTCYLAELRM